MSEASEQQIWVTTANNFEGYRVAKYLGIVRGITVRSRGALGQIGASFQRIMGGNITLYTEMCEHAREEAYVLMCRHALEKGANAVLAFRYDATEVGEGTTEVLAYGTAAVIEAAG